MTWFNSHKQLNNLCPIFVDQLTCLYFDAFHSFSPQLLKTSIFQWYTISKQRGLGHFRSSGSFFRLRIGARPAVAQLVSCGEVGPEGFGQVVKLVVGSLSTELLHPAEEVWGPEVPVGHGGIHRAFVWLLCMWTTDGFTCQMVSHAVNAKPLHSGLPAPIGGSCKIEHNRAADR